MTPRVPSVALALLLAALPLAAQKKFTSRVDSVRVDVLVTQGGGPVAGLGAEDFEVRDNGTVQNVHLITTGTLPLDVMLALDMSSSLDVADLAALRRASGLLLNALQPEDHSALLTFNHAVALRQPLTPDTPRVRAALEQVHPSGGTSLADAMYSGVLLSEAAGRRPLLIVFSDGIDTMSWLTADDVIDTAKRHETVVYGVSTAGQRQTPPVLRDVVSQSGGNLLQVTSRDLEASFVRILEEFRQRYVLSYTLPAAPAPGWHRIDVRVKRRGMSVRARAGYLVGPPSPRR